MTVQNYKQRYMLFKYESTNPNVLAKAAELNAQYIAFKKYERKPKRDWTHAFNVILTSMEVFDGYDQDCMVRITRNSNNFSGPEKKGSEYTSEQKEVVVFLIKQGFLKKVDGVKPVYTSEKSAKVVAFLPFAYVMTDNWREKIFSKVQCKQSEIKRNHLADFIVMRKPKWKTTKKGREKYQVNIPITAERRKMHSDLFNRTESLLKDYDKLMAKTDVSIGNTTIAAGLSFMKRVFSHDSFNKGGRYYHPLQNKKKDTRKHFRFNNEPTLEIDYSGIHPSLVYAYLGKQVDPDVIYSVTGCDRDQAKVAFNILLNRESPEDKRVSGAFRAIADNLSVDANTAKQIVEELYEANPEISHLFGTGFGLELQYMDSLIATLITERFVELEKPIIPVHDSFIISVRDTEDLVLCMVEAYRMIVEQEIQQETVINGLGTESLDFHDDLNTAISDCFNLRTEHLTKEVWDKLTAKEPTHTIEEQEEVYNVNNI